MNSQIANRPKTAAIVPAYNEAPTVGEVVKVIKMSPLIDEVIVVSDGSTDETAQVAHQAGAKVIVNKINLGKGQSMLKGALSTDAPLLIFIDADLIGLTLDHLEQLLLPVISKTCDMNVGLVDRGPILNRLTPHLPLISGERALKRGYILDIDPQLFSGFMVEIAINYYCRTNNLRVGTVILNNLTIRRKYNKVGWLKGAIGYIKMSYQIAKAMILSRIKIKRVYRSSKI